MLTAADTGAIRSAHITNGKVPYRCMPHFTHDLHSLQDLHSFAQHLVDSDAQAATSIDEGRPK